MLLSGKLYYSNPAESNIYFMTAAIDCRHKHLKIQLSTPIRSEFCPQSIRQQFYTQTPRLLLAEESHYNIHEAPPQHSGSKVTARSPPPPGASKIIFLQCSVCRGTQHLHKQPSKRILGTDKKRQV